MKKKFADPSIHVRYNNQLNLLENKQLGAVEQNLFFYICSRVREKKDSIIEISFDSIRERIEYTACGDQCLIKTIDNISKNLLMLNYRYVTEKNVIIRGGLFSTFIINPDKRMLTVKVNEDLAFLLNQLDGNFTEWELNEFIHIKSVYSKRIYRLCKEWRSAGKTPMFDINEFKTAIGLQENYENKKFVARILANAMEDLSPYFKRFRYTLDRDSGRGRQIKGISFVFTPWIYVPEAE